MLKLKYCFEIPADSHPVFNNTDSSGEKVQTFRSDDWGNNEKEMERVKGFEPSTITLAT